MALPKQVQRQLEQTAQIEAQIYGTATETPAPADPVVTETPVATPPAPEPQSAPEPAAPVVEPQPQLPAVDPQEIESLKQRYATLQGKYDAEVTRVHHDNRELRGQLTQLAQQIEALKQKPADDPAAKPLANDKDVEDFGADMVDMVRRHATDVLRNLMDTQLRGMAERLEGRVVALEQTINGVAGRQQQTEEQRFYADLSAQVPNWQAINTEQGWLNWLTEEDQLTGMKRQALLDDASSKMDLRRVVGFFRAYEATKPAAPVTPAARPQDALAKQVAPSRASATATPSTPEKKFWNDAAVNAFYADVRKGVFKGREADMQRIENDIHAAAAEGRYLRG